MNVPKESIFAIGVLIAFMFTMFMVAVNQRNEYCKLLIDFGHARYTIDPVTGISKFEIDPSPNKTSK